MSNLTKFYEDTQRAKDPQKLLSYFTNCKVLSTVSQDEDEAQWLANRSRGIGGSEIGTICGVNKYSTPRLLYFKKTGQYQDSVAFEFNEQAKERMHFGHKLEPLVADEYMERTGNRIVICPATLQHKDQPWCLANIDRIIVDENEVPIGLLEVKTADARLLKDWEDGDIPMSYIYQLNWYLWITDLKYGAFAALIGGNRFVMIEMFRNDELCEEMAQAANKFWNYNIANMVEPDISGGDADGEFIKEQYADVVKNSELTFVDDEDNKLANFIYEGKQHLKQLQKDIDEAVHKLQLKMQDKEIGYTTDRVIKWSPRNQTRVDSEILKKEFPDVYEKCKKQISFRVFTVK